MIVQQMLQITIIHKNDHIHLQTSNMIGKIKNERYFINKGIQYTMYSSQPIYKMMLAMYTAWQCPKYKMLQYTMFGNIASMM